MTEAIPCSVEGCTDAATDAKVRYGTVTEAFCARHRRRLRATVEHDGEQRTAVEALIFEKVKGALSFAISEHRNLAGQAWNVVGALLGTPEWRGILHRAIEARDEEQR